MPDKKFTSRTAGNLKATGRPYKRATGYGFYIYVSAVGGKSWRYDFCRPADGKRDTLTYGKFPAMSFAGAIEAHQNAKKLLEQGINPKDEKSA